MGGIQSVSWSWDGKYLAFVGQTAKQTDVYTYNIETKEIKNLTNDIFTDKNPCWSYDGKIIYFSSDRDGFVVRNIEDEGFEMYEHDDYQLEIYALELKPVR